MPTSCPHLGRKLRFSESSSRFRYTTCPLKQLLMAGQVLVQRLPQQARFRPPGPPGQFREAVQRGPRIVAALQDHALLDVDRDPVAAGALGPDQARVGGLEQFLGGGPVRRPARDADGHAQPPVQPGHRLAGGEAGPDGLEGQQGFFAARVRQGNGELVAAGVRDERALGESCGQRPLERPEDRVAGLGAVRRVQRPEAVEVGYGDGDRQVGIEQVDLGGEPVQRQCPRVVGHASKYGGATYIYEVSIWLAGPRLCSGPAAGTRCCPSFTQSGSSDRQAALTPVWQGPRIGCVITPDTAQPHLTLLTAAARFDELSLRDALASMAGDEATDGPPALAREEALELLALGELIARKAAYGRQLAVRSPRASGASWSQIGAALGISKQAAWDAHSQWIEDQAERHRRDGVSGMDPDMPDDARSLAGEPGPDD